MNYPNQKYTGQHALYLMSLFRVLGTVGRRLESGDQILKGEHIMSIGILCAQIGVRVVWGFEGSHL